MLHTAQIAPRRTNVQVQSTMSICDFQRKLQLRISDRLCFPSALLFYLQRSLVFVRLSALPACLQTLVGEISCVFAENHAGNLVGTFQDLFGSVPTTPDPNTSAKVSRYKWEAYRVTNWWCVYYFLPRRGHTFAKVSR